MRHNTQFYIDGGWVDPTSPALLDVVNPATEEAIGRISLGSAADVDLAVKAARRAFPAYSQTTRAERLDLLRRVISVFEARFDEVAEVITEEMGSPLWFSKQIQTDTALAHFKQALIVLRDYEYDRMLGATRVTREPIGVCGLITPWNWPVNQIASKLAPALAAGCTVVVKPSEVAPLSPIILAEILHEAGIPKGVFNLVNGDGPTVGHAISSHPDIDMVSFTGSTRAGIQVAKDAADTVKRVCQELGGKGANIILPGANLETAISAGVMRCFTNSGQSCQAPTRMLVHQSQIDEAVEIAKATAESIVVGDPRDQNTRLGPLVSKLQYDRVQNLISAGIKEGATLVTGGLGRPRGLNCGFYVQPTIFSDVRPDMTIAQQEIFGTVLSIITYSNEDDAVRIANGTVYGLSDYVRDGDSYVINGTKRFITGADIADFAQVFARTDKTKKPSAGISAFIVDMDTPGVNIGSPADLMVDDRPYEISFDNVRIPAENLIGEEGAGFQQAQTWINTGRIRHGARSAGVIQRCLELGSSYAKQRKTFGSALAERQAIQSMLVDSHVDLHQLRLMVSNAAWKFDRRDDVRSDAFMVKFFGDEKSFLAAHRCMQIHGGVGLSKDLPIERFFRDQRSMMITEGAGEVLKMALARTVLEAYA